MKLHFVDDINTNKCFVELNNIRGIFLWLRKKEHINLEISEVWDKTTLIVFRVESRITSRRVFLVWLLLAGGRRTTLPRRKDMMRLCNLKPEAWRWPWLNHAYSLGRNAYFLPIHDSNVLFFRYSVLQKTLTCKTTWIKECLLNNIFVKPTFFFKYQTYRIYKTAQLHILHC